MSSLDGIAKPSNSNKKVKNNSPKSEKDLGMACHTPPLKYLFKVPHGYIKALKWHSASHVK